MTKYKNIQIEPENQLIALNIVRYCFLSAVFFSPFRAYGIILPFIGNLSLFRVFSFSLFFFVPFLLLSPKFIMLWRNHYFSRFKIAGIAFALTNVFFVLLIAIFLSPNIFEGDALTRAKVKFFGWTWVTAAVLIFNSFPFLKSAAKAFILSSIIPMAIGWYQCLSFYLSGKFVKLPLQNFIYEGDKTYGVIYGTSFFRPSSVFLEPNYYAYFLCAVALITITQIINNKYYLSKIITIPIFVSCLIQLIFCMSLSAIIGFSVGLCTIIFLQIKYFHKILIWSILFFGVLLTIFSTVPTLRNAYNGLTLKISVKHNQSENMYGRSKMFSSAFKAIKNSYGFGVGFGGIRALNPQNISTSHNALLTVLADQGIIPFLLLFTSLMWCCLRLLKKSILDNENSVFTLGILAALVSMIISNMGYDAMFSFDSSWSLIGLAFAAASLSFKTPAQQKLGRIRND